MKRQWIGAVVIIAAVAAFITYKELGQSKSAPATSAAANDRPAVVLIADPHEAESSCGCGQIIRMVRSAAQSGLAVQEFSPGTAESREYRATVNPTVLFIDPAGQVMARYEGEGEETITAIRQHLARVAR